MSAYIRATQLVAEAALEESAIGDARTSQLVAEVTQEKTTTGKVRASQIVAEATKERVAPGKVRASQVVAEVIIESTLPILTFVAGTCTVSLSGWSEPTVGVVASGRVSVSGSCNLNVSSISYLNLFTSEYRQSTRMLAWARANLQIFLDTLNCLQSFGAAFNLDTAAGAQLDILGVIIGQSRTVGFQPSGGVSPVLDDATYRLLLQARVAQNHWNGRIDSLIQIWQQLFPGGPLVVEDHQDMTVDLYVGGAFTSIVQDLILDGYIIPRPQGVLYIISFAVLPMFGVDRYDAYVAGFDGGHFV